eukprot:scaffold78400_cov53-Attheya_sp.AAC.1
MVAQAMLLLHVHTTFVGVAVLVSCTTSVVTMAPPNISSTPPAEMVTSGGAASTLARVTSTAGVIALVGASVAFALIPSGPTHGNLIVPTPSLGLSDTTILPKVPCPDSGSAMFSGYKMSNTSENGQLLIVTLVELHENLELFLTNSIGLPTASDEFLGNQTASAKMTIPIGGFTTGTLFGYGTPFYEITNEIIWEKSPGLILPERGKDVILYCTDLTKSVPIAALSRMSQDDVPESIMKYTYFIQADSSCAVYDGEKVGTQQTLTSYLTTGEMWNSTLCEDPNFDIDDINMSFSILTTTPQPSFVPSASVNPSVISSTKPSVSSDPASAPSTGPRISQEPSA